MKGEPDQSVVELFVGAANDQGVCVGVCSCLGLRGRV